MAKYIISQIDQQINGSKYMSFKPAMTKVIYHIQKNIDQTFPREVFWDWLQGDGDAPFKWNGNYYHWQ